MSLGLILVAAIIMPILVGALLAIFWLGWDE